MADVKLMAHLVAGYPDLEQSLGVARALAEGGADYLEVQFPFSDPTADGPAIERACQAALGAGFTVAAGFDLMRRLAKELPIPLFIMTYGSVATARGSVDFVTRAVDAGVRGVIVPDLPPDYDEGLFAAGRAAGLAVVPVIAPGISEARLRMIAGLEPEFIYTALRLGITGSETALDAATLGYLDSVAKLGAKIIAGFGVRSRAQMLALSGHVHAAAVGSHFLNRLHARGNADVGETLAAAARELTGK